MKLPGLIDPHVHMREPGATHKEDWESGTAAALAGGFTAVLAMPNTDPPVADAATLELALAAAQTKARCDYAQFVGAGPNNAGILADLAPRAAGLKMYLDQTYGPLRLDEMTIWMDHFEHWPASFPIVAHAESRTLAAILFLASLYQRPIHLAHVSRKEEILLIRKAKEKGIPVTCEVAPHHLLLTAQDITRMTAAGRGEVRPRLATPQDRDALWENLEVIDCFASDHAPHTLDEKDGPNPPPGFPGLETSLPLLLTAVHQGRLTVEDLILRMHTRPRQIFQLPEQPDTWIEIDPDQPWHIQASQFSTRSGWSPFEGWRVQGRLQRVVLRGRTAYENGRVLALPGSGANLRCDSKPGSTEVPGANHL